MKSGFVQGMDQLGRIVIAGDFEGLGLGLGGIAGDAIDLLDGLLDGIVAGPAAVVDPFRVRLLTLPTVAPLSLGNFTALVSSWPW